MKLLIINQYYWPDYAATAQVLTDLAESLVSNSHKVTIVCSRKTYVGDKTVLPSREEQNGVRIIRVPAFGGGKKARATGRILDFLSFYITSTIKCFCLPRHDIVLTLTSPPMIGMLGWLLAVFKNTKHIHWCMDMCPDLLIVGGMIKENSIIHRILEFLTRCYIKRCDAVCVLGPYMGHRIQKYGVDKLRLHILPVWANGSRIKSIPREENWFIKEHNLANKFIVLFSGNIVTANTLDTVISAGEKIHHEKDILFVCISDGNAFEKFKSRVWAKGLTNFLFLPYQHQEHLSYSLSAAHAHIVFFRPGKEGMRVPSKIYGIMAAGGAIVYIGNEGNEVTDIIRRHNIGFIVGIEDIDGFIRAIKSLRDNPELLNDISGRARAAFEKEYDAEITISRFDKLIRNICVDATLIKTHELKPKTKMHSGYLYK